MNDRIDFERLVNERFAREHHVRPPDGAVDEILNKAGRARPLPRFWPSCFLVTSRRLRPP